MKSFKKSLKKFVKFKKTFSKLMLFCLISDKINTIQKKKYAYQRTNPRKNQ